MLQRVRLGTHHLSDLKHDEAVEQNWVFTALTKCQGGPIFKGSALPAA